MPKPPVGMGAQMWTKSCKSIVPLPSALAQYLETQSLQFLSQLFQLVSGVKPKGGVA